MQNKPLTFADFYTIVWSMVPQVWKEADDEYGKSLQILLYTMSQHMYYYFYNKIVYMDELFDPDLCPEKYLKFLAGMIGWKLVGSDVDSWREQIKAAPLLYKVRGTKRGLLLAEKLIGYSIFMSELYRDHIGDAVPKERIFNNTPETIKQKPWFRNTLLDANGELLGGQAESDQFDSFNTTSTVKLDAFGQVMRPRTLSSTRKLAFTNLSTTSRYNNITGQYSIARYAKLPRINVVLVYEHDLAEELADGSVKQNNFKGALDLLLQFKPFHVHIQNLEVRYSLSEYVFDQTNMDSETLNVHESLLSAVHLNSERVENTITFSGNLAVDITTASAEVPADQLDNRGVISSVYKKLDLTLFPYTLEKSMFSVAEKSLPVKAFSTTNKFLLPSDGNAVIDRAAFVAALDPVILILDLSFTATIAPQIISQPVNAINYIGVTTEVSFTCMSISSSPDSLTVEWYKDAVLHWIDSSRYNANSTLTDVFDGTYDHEYYCKVTNSANQTVYSNVVKVIPEIPAVQGMVSFNLTSVLTESVLDFKAMLSSQHNETSISDTTTVADSNGYNKIILPPYSVGLPTSSIVGVTSNTTPYRSSITTTIGLTTETQSITSTPSRPWDLISVQDVITAGVVSGDLLTTVQKIYDQSILVILETMPENYLDPAYMDPSYIGTTQYTELELGIDYYFDNTNIILNSATIATKIISTPNNYEFVLTGKLHLIYLTRTTYKDETSEGFQSRGFRYKTRINSKFSRQHAIDTLPQESLTRLMPMDIVSVDGKTKQKTVLGTKAFKKTTNIYNRSSLKNEVIDNYTVVNRDPLNRLDQSKWTVYSPEFTAYYLGDQKITNNWWGNYYQAKFPDIALHEPAFVPYSEIDRSEAAQKANAYSNQWISALKLLNISDPRHFLVTRKSDSARTGIWKRNSCKFVSIPFIRSRRDTLQVFRRDEPTFTRSEESTDYPVDTSSPYRLDNYKYILPDGTDVSFSYFTPGFSEVNKVLVTTDRALGVKATISLNPIDTTHPSGLQGIKGYNLTFPEADTYYSSYSFGTDQEAYFSKNNLQEYVAKSSLYAGNIPISRDPSLFTGITDGLDQLNLSITGLELAMDTFNVPANKSSFILSNSNVFVNWIEVNTGASVSFGYFPPYNINVVPNILVTLNGLLIPYGTSWSITFDQLKTLNILTFVQEGDIVTVEYQVTSLTAMETNLNVLPSPQFYHAIDITLIDSDISKIKEGNRFIIDLPNDATSPCVAWYSNITSEFISYGLTPIDYQPLSLYEEADPNVIVKVNGIPLKYKKDWLFLLKVESGVTIAAIALAPVLSLSLVSNDTVKVEYFSTT